MEGKLGRHHGGVERQQTAEQRTNLLLAEEMTCRGWDEAELKRGKKSDPRPIMSGSSCSCAPRVCEYPPADH